MASSLTLEPLSGYSTIPGPVVLIIMDGVGLGKRDESDGVYLAHTPVLDALMATPLYTELKAHGTAVGMPTDDDMGNSEVGHNTLGAGRIFPQGAKRAADAIANGELFEGATWKEAIAAAKDSTLHFLGLLSDGNVHSHISHLISMLNVAAYDGIRRIRIHILTDGRDVAARSALGYIDTLEAKLAELNTDGRDYRIASGGGRMITTMDRYNADWSIVERGWKAHVLGEARAFGSAAEAVQTMYDENSEVNDQYLDSFVISENGQPVGTIEDGDAVVCFNFRGDRVIEISTAFEAEDFDRFDRVRKPAVYYAGMLQYDGDTQTPEHYLIPPPAIEGAVSEYLCATGVTSFAVSETQKYGHVTYFWNGNESDYIDADLEKYVEIPSDRVPFEQRPWMKAAEITDAAIEAAQSGRYRFIRLNYPNGDMIGHTGVPAAVRISVEATDLGMARLLPAIERARGAAVILADHGNADCLFTEKNGECLPHVAHTLNPVPCIVRDYSGQNAWRMNTDAIETPGLSNIAATLCNLLGFEAPADYDRSLIRLG